MGLRRVGLGLMRVELVELDEPAAGLRGAVALCAPERGPAFGGIRVAPYRDFDALRRDATRLAEAMAWKCRMNGIPGAGAKVVLERTAIFDRRAAFVRLGEIVEARGGRLFVGTDSGTTLEDLAAMRERTGHIACGELSREAADGVLHAVRGACEFLGLPLRGLRAAVQGLGAVGSKVAEGLAAEGATVWGADVDVERAQRAGVRPAAPEEIAGIECDLFSPCAMGGAIDSEVAGRLRCRLVAGAANNQLSDDSAAEELHRRGIVYVPDFLANAGATIRGAWTHLRGTPGTDEEIAEIRGRTLALLRDAAARGVSPLAAAYDSVGR
jgi:leucine dehydrogenase